ncbi:Cysteine--tRNA ligase [Candidatus Bilamarchaeum dharawalense]|uniref:Cysteine--tRNA ligase n=1 Tax=Candidatus Bilamarchaeum dharawalense TaxID=2885759 RepID=A0A5E4LQ55_9ARCH|nr:Cysteine--tRNA ligase [Candidatus Bilamarchaeum dharawalense]
MRLFDSYTREKKTFHPISTKEVGIYTCGPSVYAYSHIGNFRTYLFEDLLVRYLRYKGYSVRRVMNITDVEDKAIVQARIEGKSLEQGQRDKVRKFFSDFDELEMLRPNIIARASEHIPEMIKLIGKICSRGYCKKEKDGVYFNVKKFKKYGDLAHLKNRKYLGKMIHDDYAREGLWDFRLWKFWSPADGKTNWKSQFGMGRPGWHIECSAMAMKYLGETLDIHCGGSDNVYPHHENEIAQSESATGKKFANFWLHAKHLTIGKKKMSKRTGNVLYVKQLKKAGVPPKCLRFYLTSEKYRNSLDFTIEKFKSKVCNCEQTRKMVTRLKKNGGSGGGKVGERIAKKIIGGFEDAMDDDLNTKLAYRRIFRIMKDVEKLIKEKKLTKKDSLAIISAIEKIDDVLRVF